MIDLDTLEATLIDEGRAQVFVRTADDYGLTLELAHTLLDAYPEHFIVWQHRQNDPQDYRITLADAAEERLLMVEDHPYHRERDTLDAAYAALEECLDALGLTHDFTREMLHDIHQMHDDEINHRPHPCNPYVQVGWMAGKIR